MHHRVQGRFTVRVRAVFSFEDVLHFTEAFDSRDGFCSVRYSESKLSINNLVTRLFCVYLYHDSASQTFLP